jgi:hypothetical protein
MNNAAGGPDLVEAILVLGMLAFVIGLGAAVIVRRWRGSGEPDHSLWSVPQIAVDRRWRLALSLLVIAGWAGMAIALIDDALRPGVAASLPKAIGPVPLPGWFALVVHPRLDYHAMFFMLWANAMWLTVILDTRGGPPRPFKPVYGFICFLALASICANTARIWG